jgi:hypothetical protein
MLDGIINTVDVKESFHLVTLVQSGASDIDEDFPVLGLERSFC